MNKYIYTLVLFACVSLSTYADDRVDSLGHRMDRLVESYHLSADTTNFLKHYKGRDNWFIGANVGASLSMSENTRFTSFFKVARPAVSVTVGKLFHPSFGLRAMFGFRPQMGRANWELADAYPKTFGNYSYNMAAGYLDGMVDFISLFGGYKETCKWNLYGIVGLGFNYTFGFEKGMVNKMQKGCHADLDFHTCPGGCAIPSHMRTYTIDPTSKCYFAGHAGLQVNYHISDAFDIYLEGTVSGTSDDYNGVRYSGYDQAKETEGRPYDIYADVLVGFSYHFKDHHGSHRFAYRKADAQTSFNEYVNKLRAEHDRLQKERDAIVDSTETIVYGNMMHTVVNFYIDRYYITDDQKVNVRSVANFLEKHPDVDLIVTGYADIQTGYPEYNMRLSKRRATAVYNMLVNECGVDPDRLAIDFVGDTAMAFEVMNEWNRAVLFKMVERGAANR